MLLRRNIISSRSSRLDERIKVMEVNETMSKILSYINEERGIARVVYQATNTIWNSIMQRYQNDGSEQGELNVNLFNERVRIIWRFYRFNTKEQRETHSLSNNMARNGDGSWTITFTFSMLQGKIDVPESMESIQHELEHLWERINKPTPYKDRKLYDYAKKLLNSDFVFDNCIGSIIYASRDWEHRAFANGVYGYLVNANNGKDCLQNLENTRQYKLLDRLIQDVGMIKSAAGTWRNYPRAEQTISNLVNKFGIGFEDIVKLGESGIESVRRSLYRAYAKAKDDIDKKEKQKDRVTESYYTPQLYSYTEFCDKYGIKVNGC